MHPGAMARTRRLDNYSGWMDVPQNLVTNAGTLWEDFEVYADWTLTGGTGGPPSITDDTTNYVTGTHSLLFDANGATGNIDYYKTVSTSMADMGQYFQVWVKNATGAQFTLQVFFAETWATKYIKYNVPIGDYSDQWVLYRWDKNTIDSSAGGMTLESTVNVIRIRTSGGSIQYNIDGLYHSVCANPAIVLTFDDMASKNTRNGPYALRRHNIVPTYFVTSDYIGTSSWVTADDMNTLNNIEGWILGNHSETHPDFSTLTQSEIETELTDCIADYATAGVTGDYADVYAAYPSGYYDADVDAAMAAQSFRLGRSIHSGLVGAAGKLGSMDEIDLREYDIHSNQNLTLAEWATDLNTTVLSGMIFVGYNHGIDSDVLSGSDITVSMLAQIAMWIGRYRMIPLTFDELWQLRSGSVRVRRPKRKYTTW